VFPPRQTNRTSPRGPRSPPALLRCPSTPSLMTPQPRRRINPVAISFPQRHLLLRSNTMRAKISRRRTLPHMSALTGASHASHASGARASHRSICPSVRRVHPPTSSAGCLFTARFVPQYPHSGETHWTTAAGIAPLGRLHCEAWPLLPNTLEVSHERQNARTLRRATAG